MRGAPCALAALALTLACSGEPATGGGPPDASPPSFVGTRAPELGRDDTPLASIRVTLDTGTRNGAGTDNDVVLWIDNRRHGVSSQPAEDLAAGRSVSATFRGSSIPRTLGELRRASLVLTLQIERADIASSWYCERVLLEVRPEGAEEFATYLERRDVGWLSQDEPPRRSNAFALQ